MSSRDTFREKYDQDLPPANHRFNKSLIEIVKLLKTDFDKKQQENNFEERLHGLKQLRVILRSESSDIDVQVRNFWKDVKDGLVKHIGDPRSKVQIQALVTSSMFIEEVPICRNELCEWVLDACFQLFKVSQKMLSSAAWTVTTIIVQEQKSIVIFKRIMFYAHLLITRKKEVDGEGFRTILDLFFGSERKKSDYEQGPAEV